MEEWSLVVGGWSEDSNGRRPKVVGMGPKSLKKLIHNNFL